MKPRPAQPNWPEVYTEWCAIKALGRAGSPPPFDKSGELQAAFVSEVSGYLKFRGLHCREMQAETCVTQAVESVYERVGGPGYCEAREALEATLRDYLSTYGLSNRASTDGPYDFQNEAPEQLLLGRVLECEQELEAHCRPAVTAARLEAHRTAAAYWSTVARSGIPEDFFSDVDPESVLARLPFRYAKWWGHFVLSLDRVLQRANLPACRLLEELPRLRDDAARPGQKLVLSALVQEWRQANASRTGLMKDIHFSVLEQRLFKKHHIVNAWFESRAPGYKGYSAIRDAAARALNLQLGCKSGNYLRPYWNN